MSDRILIETHGHVAKVIMNRHDKMNALDPEQIEAVVQAGQDVGKMDGIRAVVLTGGPKAFCAGLDVASMPVIAKAAQTDGFQTRTHGRSNLYQATAMVWHELPMPVIAAVEGYAFGGGFQIMLGADIRVAAPGASFSIMEAKWGLVPDMGGMVLARSLMRGDVLRRLTYTAEVFGAEDAERWGVVTEVTEDPVARAMDLAQEIAGRSPDATKAAKALITETEFMDTADVLIAESAAQEKLVGSPNQLEAVMAGMQKRTPDFKD